MKRTDIHVTEAPCWSTRAILALMLAAASMFAKDAPVGIPSAIERPPAEVAPGTVEKMTPDAGTRFLLESDGIDFIDAAGRIPGPMITVENGKTVEDPCGLSVLEFGGEPGSITIQDQGKLAGIGDGFSIAAWIRLTEPMVEGSSFTFAEKGKRWSGRESFRLSIRAGAFLTLDSLALVPEPIDPAPVAGASEQRMKTKTSYPSPGNTMNGLNRFPAGKWTHIAFTYDRARRLLRTWVDSGVDREAFNAWHEVASEVVQDDASPLVLFKGATRLRVAQVRFSTLPVALGDVPPARIDVAELPYRNCSYVRFTQTSDGIPLPAEVTVMNISPPAQNAVFRYPLNDRGPHNYLIPPHVYRNVRSDLVVRVFHKGREVFKAEAPLINPSVSSPASWRFLRGAPWTTGPKHPAWWIDNDNVISRHGTNVFPVGVYFVRTNDFDFVADLGFTMIALRRDTARIPEWKFRQDAEPYYAKAAARGITVVADRSADERPGEGFLFTYDEPWGYSLDFIREGYRHQRNARARSAELPIVIAQNNWQRYRETGLACDILAVDPYCRGAAPLRFVYDATRAALREVDGLKPVMTIVDDYGEAFQHSTGDELRTKTYLGVIAGASSVFFYSWDEGATNDTALSSRNMPSVVENFRSLLGELKALNPVLASPNLAESPAIEPAVPRGFFACAKQGTGGRRYLFIASDLFRPATKTIVYPSAAGKTAALLRGPLLAGASSSLAFNAEGKADITLPPQGTGVYLLESMP